MSQHIESGLAESGLAEDLRELAAGQPFQLDLDAAIRRGRVLRRRRFIAAGGGVAAVAAGATAVVAIGALATGAGPAAGPAGATAQPGKAVTHSGGAVAHPGETADISSASVLTARLTAAYAAAKATLKVTDTSTAFGETTETITVPSQKWTETISWNQSGAKDSVDFTYRLAAPERLKLTVYNGQNQKETLKGLFWVFRTLRIDYTTQRFYVDTSYAADTGKSPDAEFFALPQPESLKTSSWSKLTGTATVDGQPTYVLAQTGSGGVTATTWVNQHTLLPVTDVVHTYVGTTTDAYTYSTATGATAAASQPPIPPGFVNGDGAAGDGPPATPAG